MQWIRYRDLRLHREGSVIHLVEEKKMAEKIEEFNRPDPNGTRVDLASSYPFGYDQAHELLSPF